MFERVRIRIAAVALLLAFGLSGALAGDWFGVPPEDVVEPIGIAELMAAPEARLDRRLTVSGRMTDVCTNRGCWAVLEGGGEMLRIVARDHGFAIPQDARGPALAHGVFERRELTPEAARHMVDEDGADASLLDEPVTYRLVADGVRLKP